MSTQNLGPMFHGTFHSFNPGDVITPKNFDSAFATDSPVEARKFGDMRAEGERMRTNASKRPTVNVYKVEPVNHKEIVNSGGYNGERHYKSKTGFRVTGLHNG